MQFQVTVIAVISVFMALASIIAMYENLKTHIAQHKPLEKLLVFKGIIGFTFVEKVCRINSSKRFWF